MTIETPEIQVGETLLSFVRGTVEKLGSVSSLMLAASVTLKVNNTNSRENMICQVRAVVSGKQLFAERHASTFKEAAMKAVEDMKRQLIGLRT